jgi:hypothetical protein
LTRDFSGFADARPTLIEIARTGGEQPFSRSWGKTCPGILRAHEPGCESDPALW